MLTKQLHDYQDPAVDQFLSRGNLLVAFAMGLGKTPIGIACAEELLGCGDIDLCLIVCESSLKYQWAQEIAKFTDVPTFTVSVKLDGKTQSIIIPAESACVMVDGSAEKRARQFAQITSHTDYVILSYNTVVSDARWVRKLNAGLVILDEATAIKTFAAERTKQVKKILDAPYRLALTGTPVDNKPEELFSIMQWVDESVLGRWDLFDQAYIVRDDNGRPRRYKSLDVLRKRLAPALARITHDDPRVTSFIPSAVHRELYVPLSGEMEEAFTSIASDLLDALSRVQRRGGFNLQAYYSGHKQADENTEAGRIMAMITAIDMMLCHPDLLEMSANDYEDSCIRKARGEVRATWPGSKYAYERCRLGLLDDVLDSPKLIRLGQRVPEILGEEEDYKILVYSRYPEMLGIIRDELGLPAVEYKGGMDTRAKAAAVAQFRTDPKTRLFLSSYAGARGTDLYNASHLINYDLPWSAGLADQINGRHIRASSKFGQVWIENLVTEHTTDEWRLDVLTRKRRVGSAILDGRGETEIDNGGRGLRVYLQQLLDSA